MSVITASRPGEDGPATAAAVEGETSGFAHKFVAARRPLPVAACLPLQAVETDDRGVGQVNSIIQCVAGVSVLEIEKLVAELQGLRDFLSSEADRVQRQITGYVHLSDAAMKSTRIIADSVSQWKDRIDDGRADRL